MDANLEKEKHKELAELALRKGDHEQALVSLEVAFRLDPRDEGTLLMLVRTYEELGRLSKAAFVCEEALAPIYEGSGRADLARAMRAKASRFKDN